MQSNQKSAGALVKSARVLVVDDEYYTRKVIRTLLSSVGVSVATPSSPSLFEGIDDTDVPAPSGMFEMPFEPRKPSAPEGPGRSPFTYDDLITFHFLLQDDEWLAEMIGGGKAKEPGRRRRPKRG